MRSARAYPVVVAGEWSRNGLAELGEELAALADIAGVAGVVSVVEALATRLPAASKRMMERLFRLDRLTEPSGVAGGPRRAEDRTLVLNWYRDFGAEAGAGPGDLEDEVDAALAAGGCWFWLGDTGAPVSLATRRPVVAGSARIGPVYTPPEQRGHGYGSAVTAAATREILDDAAIPVLFTDLANPVSNAIYPRLGYYPVEDRLRFDFG